MGICQLTPSNWVYPSIPNLTFITTQLCWVLQPKWNGLMLKQYMPKVNNRGVVLEDVLEDTFWSPWPWLRRSSPWPQSLKSSKIALSSAWGLHYFFEPFEFSWKTPEVSGKICVDLFCFPLLEVARKIVLETCFFWDRLKIFLEICFFWRSPEKYFWIPIFLVKLAPVSLVFGLGLEHFCPWLREGLSSERLSLASDFFVSFASDFFFVFLALASSFMSSTPPLVNNWAALH